MADDYDNIDDPGMLRDLLRRRDQALAELRGETDDANDLIRRFGEYEEDYRATMESWRETFGMELTADGGWTWKPFWDAQNDLIDRYNALVKRWNRAVSILRDSERDVGRPLAASEAQVAAVLKLHRAGKSLRAIADDR